MYLDHNATSPLHPEVSDGMGRVHRELWANPSSPHSAGRSARAALERARSEVAAWLNRPPEEVIFTSGATESNAWAAQGVVSPERPIRIVSSVEHPSMLDWGTHRILVDAEGRVKLEHLSDLLSEHQGRPYPDRERCSLCRQT